MKKIIKPDSTLKKHKTKTTGEGVIASRKSCDIEGTGLSHFILMDKKVKNVESK